MEGNEYSFLKQIGFSKGDLKNPCGKLIINQHQLDYIIWK